MKNKTFKVLALVLLTVVVLNMNTINTFADLALDHAHSPIRRLELESITDQGSKGHLYTYNIVETCVTCGQLLGEYKNYRVDPHSITRDDWHMGPKHYVNSECQICSYSNTSSYPCPGNPCIIQYSLRGIRSKD